MPTIRNAWRCGPAWEARHQDVGRDRCSGSEEEAAQVSSRAQSQSLNLPFSEGQEQCLLRSAVTLVDVLFTQPPTCKCLALGESSLRVTVLSEKRSSERRRCCLALSQGIMAHKCSSLDAFESCFYDSTSTQKVKVVNSWIVDCWLWDFFPHKIQHTGVINTQYRLSDYKKAQQYDMIHSWHGHNILQQD